VAVVCVAEILSMTPFSMFLALQPQLQHTWDLSNTETGWVSSAYFTGYMLAVPVLGSLTDRMDARSIWLGACALAGVGSIGFAAMADSVWSAVALQLVTGAGLAGTYMPGLKVITDRVAGLPTPRHVAFYTTSFTIGSSLSFWIIGQLDAAFSWRVAVALAALGPLAGCLLVGLTLRGVAVASHAHAPAGVHVKAVLRSSESMRYVIGYAAHVWELFALRAWVVPFIVFCQGVRGDVSCLGGHACGHRFTCRCAGEHGGSGNDHTDVAHQPHRIGDAAVDRGQPDRRPVRARLVGPANRRGVFLQCADQRGFGRPDIRHRRGGASSQPGHCDGDLLHPGVCRR